MFLNDTQVGYSGEKEAYDNAESSTGIRPVSRFGDFPKGETCLLGRIRASCPSLIKKSAEVGTIGQQAQDRPKASSWKRKGKKKPAAPRLTGPDKHTTGASPILKGWYI